MDRMRDLDAPGGNVPTSTVPSRKSEDGCNGGLASHEKVQQHFCGETRGQTPRPSPPPKLILSSHDLPKSLLPLRV